MPFQKKESRVYNPDNKSIVFRLPNHIADELKDMVFILQRRAPAKKWSQNKIVVEAIRSWLISAKKLLEDRVV